jgi:hypothetical protein
MPFTLSSLKTAIQDYTQNSETTFVNSLDTMIIQAEDRINLAIQVGDFNTKTASASDITSGDSSVTIANTYPAGGSDSAIAPLSPLYFKIRKNSGGTSNPWSFLLLKDYNFLQEYAPVDATTGTPKYYSFYFNTTTTTTNNLATFAFAPFADQTYDWEILYLFKPPSLTVTAHNSGTWLSAHGESALLYGCLIEAYTFMKGDPDLMTLYDTRFKEALQSLVTTQGGTFRNSTYRDGGPAQSAA